MSLITAQNVNGRYLIDDTLQLYSPHFIGDGVNLGGGIWSLPTPSTLFANNVPIVFAKPVLSMIGSEAVAVDRIWNDSGIWKAKIVGQASRLLCFARIDSLFGSEGYGIRSQDASGYPYLDSTRKPLNIEQILRFPAGVNDGSGILFPPGSNIIDASVPIESPAFFCGTGAVIRVTAYFPNTDRYTESVSACMFDTSSPLKFRRSSAIIFFQEVLNGGRPEPPPPIIHEFQAIEQQVIVIDAAKY